MQTLRLTQLLTALLNLELASSRLFYADEKGRADLSAEARQEMLAQMKNLTHECVRQNLPGPFLEKVKRAQERFTLRGAEVGMLILLADEVKHDLVNELNAYLFFAVPASRKSMYLDARSWYGAAPADRFPSTLRDARDAAQCFALAQWTAAVFHAMRILEHGLRALAEDVQEVFPGTIDQENWKNIIDKIASRVGDMEQKLPKGAPKTEALQFYSAAAVQFTYFKNAWRNHVSHSRASYDEQAADEVLSHVRDFMRHLATRLRERP